MRTFHSLYASATAYTLAVAANTNPLDEKRQQLALITKRIKQYGIDPHELGIFTRDRYQAAHEKKTSENQDFS